MVERTVVPSDDTTSDLSLLRVINVLLAHRWLVIGLPLLFAVLFALMAIFGSQTFNATSILAPENGGSKASSAASIAAQFGIAVPTNGSGETPAFYERLLTSQEVMLQLGLTNYQFQTEDGPVDGNLIELLEIEGETPNQRQNLMLNRLSEAVQILPNDVSGTLTVKTIAPWPQLALQMNHRLLELADQFNGDRRRSRAGAEAKFLEDRVDEARAELAAAEASLQAFHSRNRNFASSPELVLEQARLQRNLNLKQEIYISLAKSYEQAQIDQVRNTPVLTVLSKAQIIAPAGRKLKIKVILGLILGFMIAAGIAFTRTDLEYKRLNPTQEYERFVDLRRAAINEVIRAVPKGMRRTKEPSFETHNNGK